MEARAKLHDTKDPNKSKNLRKYQKIHKTLISSSKSWVLVEAFRSRMAMSRLRHCYDMVAP